MNQRLREEKELVVIIILLDQQPKYQLRILKKSLVIRVFTIKQLFWTAFSGLGRQTGLIPLFGDPNSSCEGVS